METKKTEFEAYRVIHRASGDAQGVYDRGNYDKYDFNSVSDARNSNCHKIYHDKEKYKVARYKVTYELIEDDCE